MKQKKFRNLIKNQNPNEQTNLDDYCGNGNNDDDDDGMGMVVVVAVAVVRFVVVNCFYYLIITK